MTRFLNLKKKSWIILLVAIAGCLEPYNPPAIKDAIDILVVDGFLNSTDNTATVRLTKATALSDESETGHEVTGALVQIEEDAGQTHTLNEVASGLYMLTQMNLSADKKYRLSVINTNDKQYFSDFIELTSCPPIDSITWKPDKRSAGIDINVNTHDDTGNAKYFQWTFEESWEYTAKFGASNMLKDGEVVVPDVNVYRCWISKASSEIHVGSTEHLSTSTIRDFELMFIPVRSQKISIKYSILVEQRALTLEAYEFWTQLKKSTESLGGLFDPLPSQVLGNLHSADDSSEPVLGYFSGGQVDAKRIFIQSRDLPRELQIAPNLFCPIDSIPIDQIRNYPDMLLIGAYGMPMTEGYTTSSGRNCMDCRDDGGVLTKPDFWE